MKFHPNIPVFGDPTYRGTCHKEEVEQASFFSRLRREFPDSYGAIALHPRNEGLKEKGQFSTVIKHSAEGMTRGASDIVIPGSPSFVCELKRMNHMQSKWQDGQIEYMLAAKACGAFVCVALGAVAAWEAFEVWKAVQGAR